MLMTRARVVGGALIAAAVCALMLGPTRMAAGPEKKYAAEFVREGGVWRAMAPGERAIGDTFTATLTETIVEVGPGGTSRRSRKVTVFFADEVRSVIGFKTVGLSAEADWGARGRSNSEDPTLRKAIEWQRERDAKEGRDAAWDRAGQAAAVAYFGEERPDLAERLRKGEGTVVLERRAFTSRMMMWAGLGLSAVVGILGWRFGSRE